MPAQHTVCADSNLLEKLWSAPVSREVLPNGLTLIVKPDQRSDLASVQVWVKTGSIHEGDFLGAGLSHYLEHMLFKGTTKREGREISPLVQSHGGHINAYTSFDRTVYYIDIPAENTEVAIDVLADMVLHSTLPEDECIKEKDVILREIAMGQDDPDQRLGEALFSTAYRQHPYRYPVIGHRDVFSAVTRSDLQAYYQARYVPNNLVVVVVGNVSTDAVKKSVELHFGQVPRARLAPVYIPDETTQLSIRQWHRFEEVEISRAGLSWQIPALTHPDTPALDVLAMILGTGDSSILWQSIREKAGLVHGIDATSWNPGSTGLFYISFTCDADKRELATKAIMLELRQLARKGITAGLVKKVVRQLTVMEINTRKTVSGQASRLGVGEVVVGEMGYSRSYFSRLATVTPKEVKRVLRAYLRPEVCTKVSLNPEANAPQTKVKAGRSTDTRGDFEEMVLPNGARLLLQPDHSLPNLHFRLCGLGGPAYEAPNRRGATALMATLLTKDTKRRSAEEVASYLEEVGGSFYPVSGNNTFGLAAEVLPADEDRALEILSEAILRPAFLASTVATERASQLASLQEDNDDVVTWGAKKLRQSFFGEHPFAIGPHGDEAGVKAIKPRDLKVLYQKLMRAGNVVLAVSGDFNPRVLGKKCRALLSKIPAGQLSSDPGEFSGGSQTGLLNEKQPKQQAIVFEAYAGPSVRDDDFYVSEVMDELFSGMSSRLFERVREELGLAYFVRSTRVIGLDAAMFYFFAGTAPGSEQSVWREIDAEIKRVSRGEVGEAELNRCQVRLKAARRMGMQTNGSRAMQAALDALYGTPINDQLHHDREIDAVTTEALARFAKRYFKRSKRLRLRVGP